jgi:type IV pilus assembly protein PilX
MNRQRGTVLLMSLMFLVVLSLLGIAMVSSTSVEERMARNARDQDVAMQAAESALRDARIRITGQWSNPAAPLNSWDFADDCSNGLCTRNALQPVWANFSLDVAPSSALGTTTSSPSISGVASPPRYLIERIIIQMPGGPITGVGSGLTAHRITAKGIGRTSSTAIIVQEVVVL